MKVILLKDIRNVGQKSDIKTVADGYALNFLIPQKLAEPATDAKIAEVEAARKANEQEATAREEALDAAIRALSGARVEIHARATEKGGLFKAIGAKEISRTLAEQKKTAIPEAAIHLEHPLKTTGEHSVELVHGEVRAALTVAIVPQGE